MIVTVCSMKKFSGYSLFKMMTRQFGLERTIGTGRTGNRGLKRP